MFPLYLAVYIFHYTRLKLMARPIPVLNWPEKYVIPSARCTSVALSYLLWAWVGYETFFINSVPSSNFTYSTTVKQRPPTDYIGMKISVLPPTQLIFTVIEATILLQIFKYQLSSKGGITTMLYFIPTIIQCSYLYKSLIIQSPFL